MTRVEPYASCHTMRTLAISVKANVRAANVMPELKQAAHAGAERMTRMIMIMAASVRGSGGISV